MIDEAEEISIIENVMDNKKTLLVPVIKGKKEIKKEQIVAIKPEKQEKINGEQDHWILVESKKASRAASRKSVQLSSKGERRKTLTTIECKCSVVDCRREASSRFRCCDCKER